MTQILVLLVIVLIVVRGGKVNMHVRRKRGAERARGKMCMVIGTSGERRKTEFMNKEKTICYEGGV